MARPFWSGQIQISLVSFGVSLFPAVEAESEIHFHQISRKSGERVRHQKVSALDDEPVENNDIVKGYEYAKGKYFQIDPEEIENLRIASRHNLEIQQFVSLNELDPSFFEKPYFVVPESDSQAEAFAVVRTALKETGKAGLGKIPFGGREHLMAIAASSDEKAPGIMAYTLRFAAEVRSSAEYFSGVKTPSIDDEQLSLAKELIKRKAAKFDPVKFTDNYEAALRAVIDAKLRHVAPPAAPTPAARGKVVNLMDALRRSVKSDNSKKLPTRAAKVKEKVAKHGLTLLPSNSKRADKPRKSA